MVEDFARLKTFIHLTADEAGELAEERLEAMLLEGLESEETELTRKDFEDIRKAALAQLKARKKKG